LKVEPAFSAMWLAAVSVNLLAATVDVAAMSRGSVEMNPFAFLWAFPAAGAACFVLLYGSLFVLGNRLPNQRLAFLAMFALFVLASVALIHDTLIFI
jgi:hypothetical protein